MIKGHLELAEDRLATLRRKYEGAKAPAEVAPKAPRTGKRRGKKGSGQGKAGAPAAASETAA
ncbi:MAG: hypothetical protein AAFZ18_35705, partial [Myxococcota bacterium]